ncbi:RNA-binding protein [Candidatus Woesearchaeota archaeon CG10_big_fil_rev_8_21_14_0_10_32_9]|nr:MAG: RNA-binding protein [Candidatus Woesearchaeota archaeon CG10_big_fil_rev_8_21_14_0_10_32_9]
MNEKVKNKMGELLVKDREIVVPGQIIAKGLDFLPSHGTYRLNDDVIANRLGMLSVEGKVIRTIPMSGRYIPQRNDTIIGKVADILMSGWLFDINAPYTAVLPLKDASFDFIAKGADLTKYFNLEDYAVVKVTNVTSQNLVDISVKGPGLKRLRGGRIIYANSHKVPRIIGKKGSMVSMVKRATDCKIVVGQNGVIWLEGSPEMEVIAISAIKKIEQESHISGLTDRVKEFLEKATGKPVVLEEFDDQRNDQYNNHENNNGNNHDGNYDDQDHSTDFDNSKYAQKGEQNE